MGILGEYRDEIVLIGGWIPSLLIDQSDKVLERHPGSLDVDLALNHQALSKAGYQTIHERLTAAKYQLSDKQPFQYFKEIQGIIVQVDLLAGEYGGTGNSRRTQRIQDASARKARGCDLVFQIEPKIIDLEGVLPNGTLDKVQVPVSSAVAFVVMKAFAMADRRKRKDPFDIWYMLRYYPGGLNSLVAEFRPYKTHGLVSTAIEILADKFQTLDHIGPVSTADFDPDLSKDEREIRLRDAFERMQYFLSQLST